MFAGVRAKALSTKFRNVYSAMRGQPLQSNLAMYRYFSSIINVKLPDLGEGTKEATIKEWFVKKGSEIEEFDEL
jgi:hypothetical protein